MYVFFGEMSVQVFCPFFDWVFFVVVIELYELIYILEIKPLMISLFANIFSQSVGYVT